MDGDISSEGIVASSDDEFDGLSRAVEHHIFHQETGAPECGHKDTDWRDVNRRSHQIGVYEKYQLNYEENLRRPSFFDNTPSLRTTQGQPHDSLSGRPALPYDYAFTYARQYQHPLYQHQSYFAESRRDDMPLRRSPERPENPYQSQSNLPLLRPRLPPYGGAGPPLRRAPSPHMLRRQYSPDLHHPLGVPKYPHELPYFKPRRSPSPIRQEYHRPDHPGGRHHTRTPSPYRSARHYSPEWKRNRQDPVNESNQSQSAHPASACNPPLVRRPYPQGPPSHHPLTKYQRGRSPSRTYKESSPEKTVVNLHPPATRFLDSPLSPGMPHKHHEKPMPVNEHLKKQTPELVRRIPCPVSFKIKQKTSNYRSQPHPLDPLSSSITSRGNSKSISPDHWFHDKYDESELPEKNRETSSPGRKRTRSPSGTQRSEESRPESDDKDNKRSKMSLDEQVLFDGNETNPEKSTAQVESPESGLIHSEREDRVIFEEEQVILEEETLESPSAEDAFLLESDDDELLGLRLQALTSALNMENRAKLKKPVPTKKKSASKKKKPRHMLRRIKDRPKKASGTGGQRKSEVTDKFLKKYSTISRYHAPEKPRILPGKPSAAQLTLFGEIVRNHQPISKKETLHYIRSLPEDSEKTSMFLKFVRGNIVEESTARDVIRQTVLQKTVDSVQKQEGEQPANNNKPNSQNMKDEIDNYDEIEMDLEGDGSDTDLVPPGTDPKLIDPPLLTLQEIRSQCTPPREDSKGSESMKDLPPELLATPSQESIWSMLENPVESGSQKEIENEDSAYADDRNKEERIPSEELDIDDDGLLLLRAKLLEQIDRNQKDMQRQGAEALPYSTIQNVHSETNDLETAPLTSQYPYQPPTLKIPDVVTCRHLPVSLSATTAPSEIAHSADTAFDTQSFKTNITSSQRTQPQSLPSGNDIRCTDSVSIQSKLPIGSSPSSTPVVTTIASSLLIESGEDQTSSSTTLMSPFFAPQMSSTPALSHAQTPMATKQQRRRRRRKSRAKNITSTTNAVTPPCSVVEAVSGISDAKAKTNILSTGPTKLHSPLVHTWHDDQRLSKTIVKTATTIIKTSAPASKKNPEIPGTTTDIQLKQAIANRLPAEKAVPILPRHQPVVINLGGSSDEDESSMSVDKVHSQRKNPLEIHQDLLDAMIKQVREQASRKQQVQVQSAQKGSIESSQTSRKATPWPFSDKMKSPVRNAPLSKSNSLLNNKNQKGITGRSTVKESKATFNQVHAGPMPKDSVILEGANKKPTSAKNNQESVNQPALVLGANELLKQSRSKFLKLKFLIAKDEKARVHLVTVRESKITELKSVNEELKEMMYRVAAIKGKKARCEELLKRYNQQCAKIKERIVKRNALKTKLKEKIKQHWLQVRADKRMLERHVDPTLRFKQHQCSGTQLAAQETKFTNSSPSSPAHADKIGRLDQEKQRLLAMEKELAEKINKMKHSDVPLELKSTSISSRRSSLSKEVRSHLAEYQDTKKSAKPSAHDLSLSKITVPALSPIRSSPQKKSDPLKENSSPVRNLNTREFAEDNKITLKDSKIDAAGTIETEKNNLDPNPSKSAKPFEVEETKNLRNFIVETMANWKKMFPAMSRCSSDIAYSSRTWEKPVSAYFKKWKLDASETPMVSLEDRRDLRKNEYEVYKSPLRMFRSYRLSPFFRVKEKLPMNSETFSHKINPRSILCRYDLTGACHDPQCKAQHSKQYKLAPAELLLDILSYCPALLGKEVKAGQEYQDLVKVADSICNRLFGRASTKVHMSLDERCIMLASKVNDALRNKPPYTTVLRPRPFKPKQLKEDPWTYTLAQDLGLHEQNTLVENSQKEQPDSDSDDAERYFSERDGHDIAILEDGVKQNPHNIQLWLELSNKRMLQKSSSEHSRIELVLNTLCLALEENPYDGELWAHYLEIFHLPKAGQSEKDLDEMVSQAIEFVPLSTHIWNQLFSWDCNALKREFLYDGLISNLMKSAEVQRESIGTHLNFEDASRWLLQTVLQRTQLELHRKQVSAVLLSLETTLKDFSRRYIQACESSQPVNYFLSVKDLNSLWIAYINLKHFGSLPDCFFSNASSSIGTRQSLGIVVRPGAEVNLQMDSKTILDEEKYDRMISDVAFALKECCPTTDYGNGNCFALLWVKLRLEMAKQKWEKAAFTCSMLYKNLYNSISDADKNDGQDVSQLQPLLTETILTWTDTLIRNGDCLEATQVFDDTVTKQPWNTRLCYEAALFQVNLESADVDAALLYIETCVSAYLVTDGIHDKIKLKHYFRYLLGIPVLTSTKRPAFAKGITQEKVDGEKPYLWMIYCMLLELSSDPPELIIDSYEKAIDDVKKECDRKEILLRYLRYKQLLGSAISGSGIQLSRSRQSWLKHFTSLVRRCILMVSPQVNTDDVLSPHGRFYNYTFHNMVSSIYLSCFHSRQQMTTAYHFLTELMPYNVPLLLRACRYFLTFGDHSTVISILLKVTSKTTCQNKTIWKISTASHFSTGRIAKAIHISKQAVEAMPYSAELWSDYLMFLKAYGMPADFAAEKIRCSSTLQMDPSQLLPK